MRKESIKVCSAFIEGKPSNGKRTYTDGLTLYLHGNCIAWWDNSFDTDTGTLRRILHMNCCGWPSVTTKDRLNTLLRLLGIRAGYFTSNHQLYYGSKLRPVDKHETITIDVDLTIELERADQSHHYTIAA
jgi:hypothetical protein